MPDDTSDEKSLVKTTHSKQIGEEMVSYTHLHIPVWIHPESSQCHKVQDDDMHMTPGCSRTAVMMYMCPFFLHIHQYLTYSESILFHQSKNEHFSKS